MTVVFSVLSHRHGVGKSFLVANMAALLVQAGKRVGVIDANLAAPSLHHFLQLDKQPTCFLNDFIWGDCNIPQVTHDMTNQLSKEDVNGRLFFIPSDSQPKAIQRISGGSYYKNLLIDACHEMAEQFNLDVILLDTEAGLSDITQFIIGFVDSSIVVMRPDQQDYQGTAVLLQFCQELNVPQVALIVNQVPSRLDIEAVKQKVTDTYHIPLTAILPHTQEILLHGSQGVFVMEKQGGQVTAVLQPFIQQLFPPKGASTHE